MNKEQSKDDSKIALLPLLTATCSLLFFLFPALCYAQVASRSDGGAVIFYDSLFEAVLAATGISIDNPDEIILLADVVLDAPLIVDGGVHIRLVAGGSDRYIRRSGNNVEFPVIWIRGDGASLTLGKPDMEYELVIDGGWLNSQPIVAYAPLIAVNGLDSKLIMYDKVALQNNYNNVTQVGISYYELGAGVFIRTYENIIDRPAEFIMKGGTIRGNINDVLGPRSGGGGVLIVGFGVFTMEGGVIMNNTAQQEGGGLHVDNRSTFKKTGGIIYGANAPVAYRNTVMTGLGTPPVYGHSVGVIVTHGIFLRFRDDTVGENDNLSYIGPLMDTMSGIFGEGEKWDTHNKAFLRMLAVIILPVLAVVVCVIVILRKRYVKKLAKEIQEAADQSAAVKPEIDLENMELTSREEEICELLLTDRNLKEISAVLGLTYSGANFHAQKLYAKLGIENRTELLVRVKSNEQ